MRWTNSPVVCERAESFKGGQKTNARHQWMGKIRERRDRQTDKLSSSAYMMRYSKYYEVCHWIISWLRHSFTQRTCDSWDFRSTIAHGQLLQTQTRLGLGTQMTRDPLKLESKRGKIISTYANCSYLYYFSYLLAQRKKTELNQIERCYITAKHSRCPQLEE